MAIDSSKFFDSIRVKPTKTAAKQKAAREEVAMCEAPGCKNRGAHRAEGARPGEGLLAFLSQSRPRIQPGL
jgi:hypothetical protein